MRRRAFRIVLWLLALLVASALVGYCVWLYLPQEFIAPPSIRTPEPKEKAKPESFVFSSSAEEYSLYAAAVQYLYWKSLWNMGKSDAAVPFIVVRGYTSAYASPPHWLKSEGDERAKKIVEEEHLPPGVGEDYCKNNERTFVLLKPLDISKKCYLMSSKEYAALFSAGADGWSKFDGRYPHCCGYIGVSRPGICQDTALIYGEIPCGPSCGRGMFLVLFKKDGAWSVVKEIEMWIS